MCGCPFWLTLCFSAFAYIFCRSPSYCLISLAPPSRSTSPISRPIALSATRSITPATGCITRAANECDGPTSACGRVGHVDDAERRVSARERSSAGLSKRRSSANPAHHSTAQRQDKTRDATRLSANATHTRRRRQLRSGIPAYIHGSVGHPHLASLLRCVRVFRTVLLLCEMLLFDHLQLLQCG